MTDKPPTPEPDDTAAERRFNETLGRMLNTPHKPHKPQDDEKPRKPG